MRSNWTSGLAGAVVAFVAIALLGAGMAESKPKRGCHGHGPSGRLDRLEGKLADLGLDTETRAAAARVIEQARAEAEERRDQAREERHALRELMQQDPPAVEQVMAQADTLGALETERRKAKLRTLLELRALLTSEQWEQLHERRHRRGRAPMEES
jgi:Spy/CpxP family protein refolding chaperone